MKEAIFKSYGRKGEKIVNMNNAAVDAGVKEVVEVPVPDAWLALDATEAPKKMSGSHYVDKILKRSTPLPVMTSLFPISCPIPTACSLRERAATKSEELRSVYRAGIRKNASSAICAPMYVRMPSCAPCSLRKRKSRALQKG